MATKVLMVFTNYGLIEGTSDKITGWYLPEAAHPYFKFLKAGYEIEFASPSGGATTVTPASVDLTDAENKLFYEDAELMARTNATKPLADCKGSDYDIVFFVGGFGTMWDFPMDENVQRVQREVYEKEGNNGIIGAVCHGPICLSYVTLSNGESLIAGKGCTGFCEEEEAMAGLKEYLPKRAEGQSPEEVLSVRSGGKYTKAEAWHSHVVVDSRIVTGQNPQSAAAVGDAIVQLVSA